MTGTTEGKPDLWQAVYQAAMDVPDNPYDPADTLFRRIDAAIAAYLTGANQMKIVTRLKFSPQLLQMLSAFCTAHHHADPNKIAERAIAEFIGKDIGNNDGVNNAYHTALGGFSGGAEPGEKPDRNVINIDPYPPSGIYAVISWINAHPVPEGVPTITTDVAFEPLQQDSLAYVRAADPKRLWIFQGTKFIGAVRWNANESWADLWFARGWSATILGLGIDVTNVGTMTNYV